MDCKKQKDIEELNISFQVKIGTSTPLIRTKKCSFNKKGWIYTKSTFSGSHSKISITN